MTPLLQQLKHRRLTLGLKQRDMMLRVGVSRQQYQRLESKGNPRLDTLELIAKGLNSTLMLIPEDKLSAVRAVLEKEVGNSDMGSPTPDKSPESAKDNRKQSLVDNPWQGLLGEDIDER
ncbi:MAG TPA: XRE family transcriptional regulator [Marinobacter sp.]|uniref:XRE family transcriptional regulator n=2 Tax=root TaxID=1 RepID=A0A831R5S7_9GAMM|nr:helix-turn-helix transcriptional regulator [Marinobacter antarcticus]HDZ38041.1 XRE family transcriptional regulator [Marinobacter sp.]HEA54266.1 XRE family transcriptional regulator [Marinobacter antarcticus]